MKKIVRLSVLSLLALSLWIISCKSSTDPDSNSHPISIISPAGNYVWSDSMAIDYEFSGEGDIISLYCYLNGMLVKEINTPPYLATLDISNLDYGSWKSLQLKAYVTNSEEMIESAVHEIMRMPFPFYESYLDNFSGITATNANGVNTGTIDINDWQIHLLSEAPTGREGRLAGIEYLYATQIDREVTLHWATNYEINNSYFNIYRGLNSSDWQDNNVIQLTPLPIPGNGNSSQIIEYEWSDTYNIEYITYYYWLEMTDTDGTKQVHLPDTGYQYTVQQSGQYDWEMVAAYPNPAISPSTIGYTLAESSVVSALIVNEDSEIVDSFFYCQYHTPGYHQIIWDSVALTLEMYRFIIYIESDSGNRWGYGDITTN
ncbi:MAG: hypothetical protein K8S56_03040 [Candidatus Cloacimonetes bacterium]|nr:hypothetical protein [Candidatus Cloacimonadota bacterium]